MRAALLRFIQQLIVREICFTEGYDGKGSFWQSKIYYLTADFQIDPQI